MRAHRGARSIARPFTLLAAAVWGAALMAVALVALASGPARAHTALSDTSPQEGSTVETVDQVRLEFAGSLLELGAEVSVVGADGVDYSVGDVLFPNTATAVVQVEDLPDGDYTVHWRVVAEDGHPLEGAFSFTVVAPPAASPSPSPSPSPSRVVVAPAAPEESEGEDGAPVMLILSGVALAAAGGAVLYLLVARARASKG